MSIKIVIMVAGSKVIYAGHSIVVETNAEVNTGARILWGWANYRTSQSQAFFTESTATQTKSADGLDSSTWHTLKAVLSTCLRNIIVSV